MEKRRTNEKKLQLPLWVLIFAGLFLFSVVILLISFLSPVFADFFNRYISGGLRFWLAKTSNIFPFSIAEILIILLPLFLVFLIVKAIRKKMQTNELITYFVKLIAAGSVVFSLFILTFGIGYHTPTLYDRFSVPNDGVSTEELARTAEKLVDEINARIDSVNYSENRFSVMPYDLKTASRLLSDSFDNLSGEIDFMQGFSSRVKPVLLSIPMSYTHTTGIYTFFSGEANLNIDFPDYTLGFTAAHELAHQRGIAREDEANFIAFLTCLNSGDPYLEYCAYLNMFEYVGSGLYNASQKEYSEILSKLSPKAIGEMVAYSEFFDKYRDAKAGEVSSAINNAYLVANGNPAGTKSYGLVVDLAVAYFEGMLILN